MKLLRFGLGLMVATMLQTLGPNLSSHFPAVFDFFLVLAVWHSLAGSMGWSLVGGTVAGLCRDALSGGLFGLNGFATTLVTYVSARVQQRLLIQRPLQIGLLFAAAATLQLALLAMLQALLLTESELPGIGASLARVIFCGLLGILLSVSSARFLKALESQRERRRSKLRISV